MAKEQKFLKTVDGVHKDSYMIITGVNIWVCCEMCLDSDHVSGAVLHVSTYDKRVMTIVMVCMWDVGWLSVACLVWNRS